MMQSTLLGAIIAAALAMALVWFLLAGRQQLRARQARARRERAEDGLKYIFRCESERRSPTLEGMAGALGVSVEVAAGVLDGLDRSGWIRVAPQGIELTTSGQREARHLVQAHRLWERYLADRTGYPEEEWHGLADAHEHRLDRDQVAALSRRLGHPTHDPHGDPIPRTAADPVAAAGTPLSRAPTGVPLRVIHVEDEPATVYNQLLQLGIAAGVELERVETADPKIAVQFAGARFELGPLSAANVLVEPWPEGLPRIPFGAAKLSDLHPGDAARVVALGPQFRKLERRRLMDLGLLPGTPVQAELDSPSGDPTAYRVRDTLIALRREQADWIYVELAAEPSA